MNLQYLNNYRAVAILLVVLSHAASVFRDTQSPLILAMNPIFGTGTLLFVLVAGQFFGAMSKGFDYGKFMSGKIKFVLLPYFIVSAPAALIYVLGYKVEHQWVDMEWFASLGVLERYVYLMLTGAHLGPLWFVPMIFLYYLASPVWIFLLRTNRLLFPILLGIFLASYLGRPSGNSDPFRALLYFLPVYLLGMYLSNDNKLSAYFERHPVFGLVSSVVMLLTMGAVDFGGVSIKLVLGVAGACYLMAVLKKNLNRKNKILDLCARLSFYIFFVHGYFAGAFRFALKNHQSNQWDSVVMLALFFLMLVMCVGLYVPLRYWLGDRSKYIIGG